MGLPLLSGATDKLTHNIMKELRFLSIYKYIMNIKKFKEIYPNKYSSSSDFWNIRITEARVDSEEKYEEEAGWILNEFNFQ